MRKVLTAAGIVLAALATVAGAGWFLLEHQARAALDRAFRQAERQGATASYEKVEFDFLSQSVEITGLRYERAGPDPVQISIRRFAAEGLPLSLETFGAERIRLEGVSGEFAQATFRTNLVELHDVSAPAAALNGAGPNRLETLLGRISARAALVPEIFLTFAVGGNTRETVVRGILVTDLGEGRIESAELDGITGRLRSPAGRTLQSAEYGKGRVEGVDLAALVRVALTRTGVETVPFARVVERITHEDARITGIDGNTLALDGLELTGLGLKPGPMPLPAMAAVLSEAGRIHSPAARRIVAETAAELFSRFRFDRFEATNLVLAGRHAPQAVRIGRVAIDTLENARLGQVAFEKVTVAATPIDQEPLPLGLRSVSAALGSVGIATSGGPVTLERLSIRDLSLVRFLGAFGVLVETTAHGREPSPDLLMRLLPEASALELSGAAATLNTGVKATLATFAVDLAPGPDGLPKAISAEVDGLVVPLGGAIEGAEPPPGINALELGFVADAARNPEIPGFEIRELTLTAGELGALTLRATVDGLGPKAAFQDAAGLRAALDRSSLQSLELTFANRGAVERLIKVYAQWNGTTIEEARQILPEMVRTLFLLSGAEQLATDVSTAVRTFVADPRSLTLRLTPPRPVTMLELANAVEVDPMSVFSLMTLSVAVNE